MSSQGVTGAYSVTSGVPSTPTSPSNGTQWKCHTVAMILLALVAAAGSAAFIIYSGGPAQFELFASGVTLGGMAAALLIWTAIDSVRSACNAPVIIMRPMKPIEPPTPAPTPTPTPAEQRQALIEQTLTTCFTEGHVLTDDEKALLNSLDNAELLTQAQHSLPRALGLLYNRQDLSDAVLTAIFTTMTTLNPQTLFGHFQNMSVPRQTALLKQLTDSKTSEEAATYIVKHILTTEFVESSQKDLSPEVRALLAEIGRWPAMAAHRIYLGFHSENITSHKAANAFINLIYEAMSPVNQMAFVDYMVQFMKDLDPSKLGAVYVKIIQATAKQTPPTLAQPTVAFMAKNPRALAHVPMEISDDAGKDLVDAIIKAISTDDMNAYQAECRVVYFQKFPNRFKEEVLTNQQIGTLEQRGNYALSLLEQMGKEAQAIIESLDNGPLTVGFPYYNYLANMLMEEAKAATVVSPLPESRHLLIARFAYAQHKGERIIDISRGKGVAPGSSDIWKLKPDGKDWTNFNAIASVYTPRR